MSGAPPPPARERNRFGIRTYGENPPSGLEALLDRVEIRVRGTLTAPFDGGFERFAERIGTGSITPLFGRAQKRGGRWEASILSGSTISGGDLAIYRRGLDAWLDLTLVVNPIRTLGHLLDRHDFEEIGGLSPSVFFARAVQPAAAARTLDRSDNMVADFLAFSGSVHAKFVQRVATFLAIFEEALKRRIVEALCPPDYDYELHEAGGVIRAWDDWVELALDWGGLTVSQCEVCWERHHRAALDLVHHVADGVLVAARSATVTTHPLNGHASVERELGAVSITVPVVRERITFALYAKAHDRLRFELRYTSGLPDEVRHRLPQSPRTLVDWFDAIRAEAATRVPWAAVRELSSPPDHPTVDALADLLAAVADVTEKAKPKRATILRQLLVHGAITATTSQGDAPSALLERLALRGIIEHVRLVGRDAKVGRRYRLAPRFDAARRFTLN